MPDKGSGPSQTTLLLRLLCGGYLIYLGVSWLVEGADALYTAAAGGSVLFAAAAVLYILVGAALLFFTLRTGFKNWKKNAPEDSDDSDGADKDEV